MAYVWDVALTWIQHKQPADPTSWDFYRGGEEEYGEFEFEFFLHFILS